MTDLVGFPRRSDGLDEVIIDGQAYRARDLRSVDLPSFGVTSKARSWKRYRDGHDLGQLTAGQIGALQGFRLDYPWQGSRTAQIQQSANAVPPPMAAALIDFLTSED